MLGVVWGSQTARRMHVGSSLLNPKPSTFLNEADAIPHTPKAITNLRQPDAVRVWGKGLKGNRV